MQISFFRTSEKVMQVEGPSVLNDTEPNFQERLSGKSIL